MWTAYIPVSSLQCVEAEKEPARQTLKTDSQRGTGFLCINNVGICPSVVDSDELRMLNWCQIGMHEAAFLLYWRACNAPTQFGGGGGHSGFSC